MDADDRALRVQDLELRREELSASRRSNGRSFWIAVASVIVTAAVAVAAIVINSADSNDQLRRTQQQFVLTSRATEYNDIIQGLSSNSPAVQINSIRRLTEFVKNLQNFAGSTALQHDEATNAVQTLLAFVHAYDASTSAGLPDWDKPQAAPIAPALTQLNRLASDSSLGPNSIDLSGLDLHGLTNLKALAPHSGVNIVDADLREANLSNLDLAGTGSIELRRTFFTCANLSGANLNTADLANADLTGADLTGADLSKVQNLKADQLQHARFDKTKWAANFTPPTTKPWTSDDCQRHVQQMTGMPGGEGYDPQMPCPVTVGDPRWQALPPADRGRISERDAWTVCSARQP